MRSWDFSIKALDEAIAKEKKAEDRFESHSYKLTPKSDFEGKDFSNNIKKYLNQHFKDVTVERTRFDEYIASFKSDRPISEIKELLENSGIFKNPRGR